MKLENDAGRSRRRRSREEVKRLVDEFEASGSDRVEFCRSRGLGLSTLQRHLRARVLEAATRGGGSRLVAVRVTPMTEAIAKPPEPGDRANWRTADRRKAGLSSWNAARIDHGLGASLAMFGLGPATKVFLALKIWRTQNRAVRFYHRKRCGPNLDRTRRAFPTRRFNF
jgi:hypothetical protein